MNKPLEVQDDWGPVIPLPEPPMATNAEALAPGQIPHSPGKPQEIPEVIQKMKPLPGLPDNSIAGLHERISLLTQWVKNHRADCEMCRGNLFTPEELLSWIPIVTGQMPCSEGQSLIGAIKKGENGIKYLTEKAAREKADEEATAEWRAKNKGGYSDA